MRILAFNKEGVAKDYHSFNRGQWASMQLILFIANLILFLPYELVNGFNPIYNFGSSGVKIVIVGIFTLIATLGRWIFYKRIRTSHRGLFVRITDLIFFSLYVISVALTQRELLEEPKEARRMFMLGIEFLVFYLVFTPVVYGWFYSTIGIIIIYILNANKTYNLSGGSSSEIIINSVVILGIAIFLMFMFERGKRSAYQVRHQLQQKEKVWKEVLDIFPECAFLMDKNHKIRYANNTFFNLVCSQARNKVNVSFEDLETLQSIVFDQENPTVIKPAESMKLKPVLTRKFTKFHKMACDEPEVIQDICEAKNMAELISYMKYNWVEVTKYFLPKDQGETIPFIIFQGRMMADDGEDKLIELKLSMKKFEYEANVLIVISDLGEKFRAQSLKEAMIYKNRLLQSVSNQLKTPLTNSIDFIQTVVHDPSVQESLKKNLLQPAIKSAKYLMFLINDILDFSQMASHNITLNSTKQSLLQTLREATSVIDYQVKQKKLGLSIKLPSQNWDVEISTDHNRLLQILLNLLTNSIQSTEQGQITILVKPVDQDVYEIQVKDTGKGIKESEKPKLMNNFGNLQMGIQDSYNVGLGLIVSNALAQELAPRDIGERTGPGISFESEYGKGSLFYFSIADLEKHQIALEVENSVSASRSRISRMEQSHLDQPDSMIVSGREGASNSRFQSIATEIIDHDVMNEISQKLTYSYLTKTFNTSTVPFIRTGGGAKNGQNSSFRKEGCECPQVLIADSDPKILSDTEITFEDQGFSTLTVMNGREAYQALVNRNEKICSPQCISFQMIILGINLEIVDGYETCKKMKALFMNNNDMQCPIIAHLDDIDLLDKDKMLEAGMDDFVVRPINKTIIEQIKIRYKLNLQPQHIKLSQFI